MSTNSEAHGGGSGALSTVRGAPVAGFPIEYEWYTGAWERIFDRQTELVREDVMRARMEDRLVIYLSVPISRRGGSFAATNVDIAMAAERRILQRWGEGVWVLNPARYQMESKGGYGLIEKHAREEKIDIHELLTHGGPRGGDYMRMWTRVLVEDAAGNMGGNFDAFYFLGPSDVHEFFGDGKEPATRAIQGYFASKYATDAEFRYSYTERDGIDWGQRDLSRFTPEDWGPLDRWEAARKEFLRFYILRASGNFSLGARDEWNTWVLLNRLRLQKSGGDAGAFLPGFFDGRQVDPGSSTTLTTNGYGTVTAP